MSKHATGSHKDQKSATPDVQENGGAEPAGNPEAVAEPKTFTPEPKQPGAGSPCEGAPAEDAAACLEVKLAEAASEISALKDQYLRKCADFENFRKRVQKEKEESLKYANTNLLVDLIDIIDNFDRAVQSAESSRDFQSLHDGILMLQKQFLSMLESKYSLKRFESRNQEFHPNRHEAVMSEERDGLEHPVVSEDFMKGYLLHDRIVRSAKVKVAMPKAGAPVNGQTTDANEGGKAAQAPGAGE